MPASYQNFQRNSVLKDLARVRSKEIVSRDCLQNSFQRFNHLMTASVVKKVILRLQFTLSL